MNRIGSAVRGGVAGIALLALALAGSACAGRGEIATADLPLRLVKPGVASEILLDAPEVLILDVRSPSEFASTSGRLETALNLPHSDLEAMITDLSIDPESTILVYGGDGGEAQRSAARTLHAMGFRFVFVIKNGLEGWLSAGFPVEVEETGTGRPTAAVE